MKEVHITFKDFSLIINVGHQRVVYINWLGQCESYSMERFFELLETIAKG